MQHADFIAHLNRKGALRDGQASNGGGRRGSAHNDTDWVGLTKLTAPAFADELAAFYRCERVQRQDLLAHRFVGERLSPRFLKERRLFPFETQSGTLVLAIAAPTERELYCNVAASPGAQPTVVCRSRRLRDGGLRLRRLDRG